MALPKIDTPIYDLTLPLSNKEIRFRPFLVKEQKNLLMAMEADDKESIEKNVKQVLINCTLTEGINIEKLPVIDVEYYFLNLRARSVGELVENNYRCDNEVNGEKCGNVMKSSLNILDIKVEKPENDKSLIQLTDDITIKLRYPEYSLLKRIAKLDNLSSLAFEMVADCVEYIFDGEQYYYANEVSSEEMVEFIENMNQQQFSKIEDFFSDMPKLEKKIEMKCSKCGFEHKIEVQGLENFFG
jgi:hypothetical protein